METKEASVDGIRSRDFVERVRLNQPRLSSEMKSQYDFIICGSGTSPGSGSSISVRTGLELSDEGACSVVDVLIR
jgi:hypothetical protein